MLETRFAAACDKFGIPWRRYDGPDIITPLGNHRPNFIINLIEGREDIIEIKGQFEYEDLIKSEKAKEIYGKRYSLLLERDLKYFEENGIIIRIDPSVPDDFVANLLEQFKNSK